MINHQKQGEQQLEKVLTGIQGLDEITYGGLPKARPTLVCGNAGCGKTLMAMEFLVRGAMEYGDPGVFMSFEEKELDLSRNFSSLSMDLEKLKRQKKLRVDYVHIERNEIEETGAYDLSGLFIRVEEAVRSIGAKRVVLDTIEALFSGFNNEALLRAEMRRLFNWLKDKGLTAVITGERGNNSISKFGLEEYVADCVILLDNRISDQVLTRRLRIVKYRGSSHGTNEYPFMISDRGISILPITSNALSYKVSTARLPSGILMLDKMLDGKGFFQGSSILISGPAGSGKTSFACKFMEESVRNGKRVLYFAFEESVDQIRRNMTSIGVDFAAIENSDRCEFYSTRPTFYGLEQHLLAIHKKIEEFSPDIVIMDPITNLMSVGNDLAVKSMLTRLADFLKNLGVTILCTDLSVETTFSTAGENGGIGISSLVDSWIVLRFSEKGGRRSRALYVLKSRGMSHSDKIAEFALSSKGVTFASNSKGAVR